MNEEQLKESEFQSKCGEFVAYKVFCCVSQEVQHILQSPTDNLGNDAPFNWDDIENLYEQYGTDEGDHYDSEIKEIFEWWKCDSWLIEKLAEEGEPVIRDFNLWGRTTTGQAIKIDSVIRKLVKKYRGVQ